MSEQSSKEAQEQLAKLIEGRSDEDIIKSVEEQGVDVVLGNTAQGMAAAFIPEKAANVSAVIQYDITATDGIHSFQLKVGEGKCETSSGAPDTPRVTISLALPDFLRLVAGKLNGQQAFMSGKLKLKGDMAIAMQMQNWFPQNV
jgi:putative sterol carrier protein